MERKEHYQNLKRIPITEYASVLGYTVVRKGRYYSLKEHDSVMIDPERNCFWRNSMPGTGRAIGKGGSIIDFVMELDGVDVADALKQLEQYSHLTAPPVHHPVQKQKSKKLELPKAAENMRRVFAYLIKTRKISLPVVQQLVDNKQLYQDIHGNCVFVSFHDKKPVFACLRGTNTEKPFYGDVEGCDYTRGFFINHAAKKLYVTEAVIDAMSVMSLKADYKEWNYLALTGVGKWELVKNYVNDMEEVWIGTDNDAHGKIAADYIASFLAEQYPEIRVVMDFPNRKDWNLELKEGK